MLPGNLGSSVFVFLLGPPLGSVFYSLSLSLSLLWFDLQAQATSIVQTT